MGRSAGARGVPAGRNSGGGGMMRWWLAVFALLARLAGCDGDAPILNARLERVGALTFVVALNLSASGEVDIVTTRVSEYPNWASARAPPALAALRAAVTPGGTISTDPSPPAYFRRTVRVPTPNRETRVLVDGAYNLQRPERSGAYGDFVVYPNATYVVVLAPRDDADGVANVTALEVTTATSVSSDASLANFGVVVSATTDGGVVDAAASASAAASATFAPLFSVSSEIRKYEASVDAATEEVTVFASPAAEEAFQVTVDGVAARAGPARFGGVVPSGAYSAGRARVFYGRNAPIAVVVTAEDRVTTRTYEVRVTRSRSSEARLGRFALRSVATTPAFSPDVFAYFAAVSHDTASARVFAEPLDTRAQAVRVNAVLIQGVDVGGDAGRGVARERRTPFSRDAPLRVGNNVVVVEVTAHDGSTKREYRVEVARAYPSTDVELAFLEVSSAVMGRNMGIVSMVRTKFALTPVFIAPSPGETTSAREHFVSVDTRVRSVTILAAARDKRATLLMTRVALDGSSGNATRGLPFSVRGVEVERGLPVNGASVPFFEFVVDDVPVGRLLLALTATAEDSRYDKTTRLEMARDAPGSQAALNTLVVFGEPGNRSLLMTPAFDPDQFEYAVALDFDARAARLVPTAEDAGSVLVRVNAVVQKSGETSRTYPVAIGGRFKFTATVTAEDGQARRSYVVVVTRGKPNSDASLSGLTIMPAGTRTLLPAFDPNVTSYTLSAPLEHTVSSVRVAPTVNHSKYDRVLVNGVRQMSGTLSREIAVPPGFGNGARATFGVTTVTITVIAQDGFASKTYVVRIQRTPAPIYPNDATLRELKVAPERVARLVPPFTPFEASFKLYAPARAAYAGVTPVANDVNAYKIEVNGIRLENENETRVDMAELLRREDVFLRIEVFAANCDPSWRPEGFTPDSDDAYADEDGDGVHETLLLDGKYRPTWCTSRLYTVEVLEYGPGAYEGAMRLRSGDQEHPTRIVREMTPYPSPFGDAPAFLESLESKPAAEFDGGVRSTGIEGECDEYLCANSVLDPSLVAMEVRIASVTPMNVGDDPLPATGASVGDALAYAPTFSNVTRFYVLQVPSFRVAAIAINVTAASANVSSVRIGDQRMTSGVFSASLALNPRGATDISVDVVAGVETARRRYALRAYRPRSNNAYLKRFDVLIGSANSKDVTLLKRAAALISTGTVPKPVPPCDAHDATVRAANGVLFHPLCDDGAATNFTTADNDPPSFRNATTAWSSVPSTATGPLTHPCDADHDAEAYFSSTCAENETVSQRNFSRACDDEATSASVFPVTGFHHEWYDYLVNVDDGAEYVSLLAETSDVDAERVGMGGSFRNCRAAPRSPGCAGRDVGDVAAWGWTAGEFSGGVVAVESGRLSPPLDLKASPGSTTASIAVIASDGVTRREYTLRVAREKVAPSPDADAAVVGGVGGFLDDLIAASPLGATTDEEVRFALRFEGMDPLHIVDASFRRELEAHARAYVEYAAVEPTLWTTATATATPRLTENATGCRRRVAFSKTNETAVASGVDVAFVATFANSKANSSARVVSWIENAGWNDAPGFAFDEYLRAFGPIRALPVGSGARTVAKRAFAAGFASRRFEYAVALPSIAEARGSLPLLITPPPGPLADGYEVTVNGVPAKLGSTAYASVPECPVGPHHCDRRMFEVEIKACVGKVSFAKTCSTYVFDVTIPGASVFAANDASLRNVSVFVGSTFETSVALPARARGGAFRYDASELRVTAPSDGAFLFVAVVVNSDKHRGAFVDGKAVTFRSNSTSGDAVSLSLASVLDAKQLDGIVRIRVFAEDGVAYRDTALLVESAEKTETVAGLASSESLDPLDPLRGAWGFDGGGLPRTSVDMGFLPTAPRFVESYPRAEPLVEGGPHVEVAAQTETPAYVYWALAVPWTRAPTRRELVEAATGVGTSLARTRMVGANETVISSNVSVYAYVSAIVNASLALGGGAVPDDVENGLVAAGVLGGAGTFGATREARATARCLDSRVQYRAYFVTERMTRGVSAHGVGAGAPNEPPVRGEVTRAVLATPGDETSGDECV